MKNVLQKLLGVAILAGFLFGAFAVVVTPIEMYKMANARDWPSRKAIITKSYASLQRGSARRAPTYRPVICAQYPDDGQQICVSRVRYGDISWGKNEAKTRAMVAAYPIGRAVDVYYDPDDPRETILEAKPSWDQMILLFAIGALLALLPFGLWLFRKQIEPERYATK
jgi:hypothetical protein